MVKQQTIYAFIDSQNLNLSIKDQGWELDFKRFYIYLKDKYKVDKIFLFIGYVPNNKGLYSYLTKVGYQLVFKPILIVKQTHQVKGNVDAELVLQAMIEYPKYDKGIIVSGDGDFYCLIYYLKQNHKLGRILIPNRAKYSRLLYQFKESIDFISNLRNKLEKKWEVSRSRTKP